MKGTPLVQCSDYVRPDDLATIKIARGPGAVIDIPKVSTKLGVVTYAGQKAIINDDASVRDRIF